jgi:hypothetical protein
LELTILKNVLKVVLSEHLEILICIDAMLVQLLVLLAFHLIIARHV